jgi:AcrR family transcriptional regulator
MAETTVTSRKRMPHAERHAQLLDAARELIREEGSDAVTLARIADRAGVTKPLVYQHFGARPAVLAELYQGFKQLTYDRLDASLGNADLGLPEVARIIADAYIDCIDAESTELPGILGALSGSSELEELRQDADEAFSARCRAALTPFSAQGRVSDAALHAILGAADGIARAIVLEKVGFAEGKEALAAVVAGVV